MINLSHNETLNNILYGANATVPEVPLSSADTRLGRTHKFLTQASWDEMSLTRLIALLLRGLSNVSSLADGRYLILTFEQTDAEFQEAVYYQRHYRLSAQYVCEVLYQLYSLEYRVDSGQPEIYVPRFSSFTSWFIAGSLLRFLGHAEPTQLNERFGRRSTDANCLTYDKSRWSFCRDLPEATVGPDMPQYLIDSLNLADKDYRYERTTLTEIGRVTDSDYLVPYTARYAR